MKKLKNWQILLLLLCIGGFALLIRRDTTKLTYIEASYLPEGSKKVIKVEQPGIEIVQTFVMPYDILEGIAVKVKTYAEDSNSTWRISLVRSSTQEVVRVYDRSASLMEKDNYEEILGLTSGIEVYPGEIYELHIFSVDVSEYKKLGFYRTKHKKAAYSHLTVNGEEMEGSLSIRITGGDQDAWWVIFDAAEGLLVLLFLLRLFWTLNQGKTLKEDRLLMGAAVAACSFLLLYAFTKCANSTFTDEMDNFRGGLVIANGGVLYRDYVTQHTPFAYYLSAVYALMGAGSSAQFRILWFATVSLIWGLMYIRHSGWYGRRTMWLIPVLNIIFCSTIVDRQGYMFLSDHIQGICFVVLALEFLRYIQDRKLAIGRCLIVSACIWGSFGSAFVSAFALLFAGIMMLLVEAGWWKEWDACMQTPRQNKRSGRPSGRKNLSIAATCRTALGRYTAFLVTLLVPPALAGMYLWRCDAFKTAYDQMYRFNTEIYTNYTSYGSSLAQPFIAAVRGLFAIISDRITSVLNAKTSLMQLMQLMVMVLALVILFYNLQKKRYFETAFLFLLLCFSSTRGYETDSFHSLAAWHMAVLIIALYAQQLQQILPRLSAAAALILTIVLTSSYVKLASDYLLTEQETVSRLESKVISLLREDAKEQEQARLLLQHPEGLPEGPQLPQGMWGSQGSDITSATTERTLYLQRNISSESEGLVWLSTQFPVIVDPGYQMSAGMFQDAYSYDSIYFIYKGFYPVNRTVYILPWYMDWYENWAVEDLHSQLPTVVLFNDQQSVWGYTGFSSYFTAILKQYYERQSDETSDSEYRLWIRKEEFSISV